MSHWLSTGSNSTPLTMTFYSPHIASLAMLLAAASSLSSRPNIFFLSVDDLGWNDLSLHGGCDCGCASSPLCGFVYISKWYCRCQRSSLYVSLAALRGMLPRFHYIFMPIYQTQIKHQIWMLWRRTAYNWTTTMRSTFAHRRVTRLWAADTRSATECRTKQSKSLDLLECRWISSLSRRCSKLPDTERIWSGMPIEFEYVLIWICLTVLDSDM